MPKATLVGTPAVAKPYPDHSACAGTNAGLERRLATHLVFATCGADDPGGLNAVVMVAPEALLFLWRGYADPAPRARPAPRFDSGRGLLAANACALPFARSESQKLLQRIHIP
jgi:hypothetical protein